MGKTFDSMINDLAELSKITSILLANEVLELYIAGGSGCILGKFLERATRDYDIIDLDYSSKIGKILNYLGEYDLLDNLTASIPIGFKDRAIKVYSNNNLIVYSLSVADIIAMKINRYSDKDKQDIRELIKLTDEKALKVSIIEAINTIPKNLKRYKIYRNNLDDFLKEYRVKLDNEI